MAGQRQISQRARRGNQHHPRARDHRLRIPANARQAGRDQGNGSRTDEPSAHPTKPRPLMETNVAFRYHELFPNDAEFNKYLIESADAAGARMESVWSLALCATAYRISKDDKYLRRHDGTLAGCPAGVLRSGTRQTLGSVRFWPRARSRRPVHASVASLQRCAPRRRNRFTARARRARTVFLRSVALGQSDDCWARGAKIVIWNDGQPALELGVDAGTLSGGDIARRPWN